MTHSSTVVAMLPDGNAESLSASWLGVGKYRITSIPVFATLIHYGDIVECQDADRDLVPRVLSVLQPSGHVTVQIVFTKMGEAYRTVLRVLEQHTIHVEKVSGQLFVASVPSDRYDEVERLLDDFPQAILRWWQSKDQ